MFKYDFMFFKGGSSLTRRPSPLWAQSSSIASGSRCLHRRQKRAFSALPAHGLQKHEEILAKVQVK